MTQTDVVRWTWTMLTGAGVLFACWNLREVLIDDWAVSQIRNRPVSVLRLQTRAEVWNHVLIMAALAADFVAGVCSLFALQLVVLAALIASAVALMVLSFAQAQQRRRIFRALRRPDKRV